MDVGWVYEYKETIILYVVLGLIIIACLKDMAKGANKRHHESSTGKSKGKHPGSSYLMIKQQQQRNHRHRR